MAFYSSSQISYYLGAFLCIKYSFTLNNNVINYLQDMIEDSEKTLQYSGDRVPIIS